LLLLLAPLFVQSFTTKFACYIVPYKAKKWGKSGEVGDFRIYLRSGFVLQNLAKIFTLTFRISFPTALSFPTNCHLWVSFFSTPLVCTSSGNMPTIKSKSQHIKLPALCEMSVNKKKNKETGKVCPGKSHQNFHSSGEIIKIYCPL